MAVNIKQWIYKELFISVMYILSNFRTVASLRILKSALKSCANLLFSNPSCLQIKYATQYNPQNWLDRSCMDLLNLVTLSFATWKALFMLESNDGKPKESKYSALLGEDKRLIQSDFLGVQMCSY